MIIKMTQVLIVLPLIAIAVSKGEVVRDSVQQGAVIQQEQSNFSARLRHNRQETKQALKLSKVALDRLKTNCIKTVDVDTKQESYFQPGERVLDTKLKRSIREGAVICNSLGDTAVVQDGVIADIARVSLEDKDQYDRLFRKGTVLNGKSNRKK